MSNNLDKRIRELVGLDCDGCSESCFDNDGNITGCPIQLQHILLAIEKSGNYRVQIRRMTADGNIQMYTSEGIYITNRAVFNLSKSYNDQEEEVHKFLAEILNIDTK